MQPSQKCFNLAAAEEGCILTAYDDARPRHVLQPGETYNAQNNQPQDAANTPL